MTSENAFYCLWYECRDIPPQTICDGTVRRELIIDDRWWMMDDK